MKTFLIGWEMKTFLIGCLVSLAEGAPVPQGSLLPRLPSFSHFPSHNFFQNLPAIPEPFEVFQRGPKVSYHYPDYYPVQAYDDYDTVPNNYYDTIPTDDYDTIPTNDYDIFPTDDYDIFPTDDYAIFPTNNYDTFPTNDYDTIPTRNKTTLTVNPLELFTSVLSSLVGSTSKNETRCGVLCQLLNLLEVIKSQEAKVFPDGSVLHINQTAFHDNDEDGHVFSFHSSVFHFFPDNDTSEGVKNADPEEDEHEEMQGSGKVNIENDTSEEKVEEAAPEVQDEEVFSTMANVEDNNQEVEYSTEVSSEEKGIQDNGDSNKENKYEGNEDSKEDRQEGRNGEDEENVQPDLKEGTEDEEEETKSREDMDREAVSGVAEEERNATTFSSEVFIGENKQNIMYEDSDIFDLQEQDEDENGIKEDVTFPATEKLDMIETKIPR